MAVGDSNDIFGRLKTLLPHGWFGDSTPLVDAVLRGISAVLSNVYSFYAYAKLQCRIATATETWLDMIAADFGLPQRKANQSDASFRATIIINLFRERGTRNAVIKILTELTGRVPIVVEPQRPADTGAYGAPNTGYSVNGAYGSVLLPCQAFITAYRPAGTGIPNVAGYGISTGAYNTASQAEYASLSMIQGAVTDADIYAAIDNVKPTGTLVWTTILSNPPPPLGRIGVDFIIGTSALA
jgi:hypothetical protein